MTSGEVRQATTETAVFPEAQDGNEWQIGVEWTLVEKPITNAMVRKGAGAGLPVRNTFCRLWNPRVRAFLSTMAE